MKINQMVLSAEHAGRRIDNFLMKYWREVPRSRRYKAFRSGEVRVNKHRIKASYRLQEGDSIRFPELFGTEPKKLQSPGLHLQNTILKQIVYEDERLIVLNKPPGLAVHGGSRHRFGIIDALRQAYSENDFLELGHRLDKDTSGCLLIAKQRDFLQKLHLALQLRKVKKMYFAVLTGVLNKDSYRLDLPLSTKSQNHQRKKTVLQSTGKSAVTEFFVIERMQGLTLVAAYPKTGRTHQIRVHAEALGHPILGDDRYGDRACNNRHLATWGRGLYLHAASLDLTQVEDCHLQGISIPPTAGQWPNIMSQATAWFTRQEEG